MQNIRPTRPMRPLTMADRDCMKHPMPPSDESVASRIEALLARCDGLITGKALHILFDERGEAAARAIAAADGAMDKAGKLAGPSPFRVRSYACRKSPSNTKSGQETRGHYDAR